MTDSISMELAESQQLPIDAQQRYSNREAVNRSRRRRETVLMMIGCAILQLPIWGLATSFGIFQEAYTLEISPTVSNTGIIGTTLNGVLYLSMPALSTLLDSGSGSQLSRYRRWTAVVGTGVSSAAILASSWSTAVWQMVVLQGVLAAIGAAMLYTPTTLFLDEWFRGGNRATAYGVAFAAKNAVGAACPILFSALLGRWGFRATLRCWAGVVVVTGLVGLAVIPRTVGSSHGTTTTTRRGIKIPWAFLRHRTFYIHAAANAVFASGYGLPQTYLSTYARTELQLSNLLSSLILVVFNAPGIVSCVGFGLMSDKFALTASTNTLISAAGSAMSVFLLWGLKSHEVEGVLIAFAICYGFFAGGYSSTWGGWIQELEAEAAERNEAINTGMIYGLMNGARGAGYVVGGLAGVQLLKAGAVDSDTHWAYGTEYGRMILFTGFSSVLGGWSIIWRCRGKCRKSTEAIRRS